MKTDAQIIERRRAATRQAQLKMAFALVRFGKLKIADLPLWMLDELQASEK